MHLCIVKYKFAVARGQISDQVTHGGAINHGEIIFIIFPILTVVN